MIVRDTESARPWCRWLAVHLLRREARCLAQLDGLSGIPQLIDLQPRTLTRSYLPGTPLQDAKPGNARIFRDAARLLRKIHRAGVAHNDLAKEPNILVDDNQQPAFVDFQLAVVAPKRGRLFRLLAYDDLRHLLKHKRSYCPAALSARELRILARPSMPARIWMGAGKPIYLFITRRIMGWSDREGAGDRSNIG